MMQLQRIYYKLCRTSHGHMAAMLLNVLYVVERIVCCSAHYYLQEELTVRLQLEMCMDCFSMTNVFVVTSDTA